MRITSVRTRPDQEASPCEEWWLRVRPSTIGPSVEIFELLVGPRGLEPRTSPLSEARPGYQRGATSGSESAEKPGLERVPASRLSRRPSLLLPDFPCQSARLISRD